MTSSNPWRKVRSLPFQSPLKTMACRSWTWSRPSASRCAVTATRVQRSVRGSAEAYEDAHKTSSVRTIVDLIASLLARLECAAELIGERSESLRRRSVLGLGLFAQV